MQFCVARLGYAIAAAWPTAASAQSTIDLFSRETFEASADVRLVAADGEKGWLDGGFGKLRSGSSGDLRVQPQLGNADLVWKPQLTWSLSAVVVAAFQGGERTQAGLSQAYLNFRPMRSSSAGFSARAGLMWPPVSLEHQGLDWHVKDSITPSAINSWIAEEVRPAAAEANLTFSASGQNFRATAALIAGNDTAGTLLTFRGWALHDRTTLAFNRWPLPPLDGEIAAYQAPFTHPLIDLHRGFAHRPGYYAKLMWQPRFPLRMELFHYDNRANPEEVNNDLEWGWRTVFNDVGMVADLGNGASLKAQALDGHTNMGFPEDGRRWVDGHFQSAFVLGSKSLGPFNLAARVEAFRTRNRGSIVDSDYDEKGWSAMIAGKHDWNHLSALVELLHVSSRREDRIDAGFAARQQQTQMQAELRMHW